MRRLKALSPLLAALSLAAVSPVSGMAQAGPAPAAGASPSVAPAGPGGNVSAVGRKMPPANTRPPVGLSADPKPTAAGRTNAKLATTKPDEPRSKAAADTEMLKAQKAAEERNKAWDGRMRKTMGSICSGC